MLGEHFLEGFEEYQDPLTRLRIKDGDPLLEWINEPNVLRMLEIGQLGLSRLRPTDNNWTRGEHSISGAITAREVLAMNNLSRFEQILGGVMMLYHDPHPAGGDGVKNFLDINEESVAEGYWFTGKAWERFTERCEHLGCNPERLKSEVLLMISRKSHSQIAKLVHNPDKSKADIDFISYTLADLSFGMRATTHMVNGDPSWRRCSGECHPSSCIITKDLIAMGAQTASIVSGGEFGDSNTINAYTFSYADFNPVGQIKWIESIREWVFSDSEVLSHLIIASAVLHRALYFHPGTQGPELLLGKEAARLGILDELKSRVMSTNDRELMEFLKDYGLDYWASPNAHDGWTYAPIGSIDSSKSGVHRVKLPKFNLRMDTPVMSSGEITSFRKARPEVVGFADAIIGDLSGREILLIDLMVEKRPKLVP